MKLKVGDKVKVIEKPRANEYRFDIDEEFTITEIIITGNVYYRCDDNRRIILGSRVVLIPKNNLIGGKLL